MMKVTKKSRNMLCIYDFLRNMRPTKLICVDIKKKVFTAYCKRGGVKHENIIHYQVPGRIWCNLEWQPNVVRIQLNNERRKKKRIIELELRLFSLWNGWREPPRREGWTWMPAEKYVIIWTREEREERKPCPSRPWKRFVLRLQTRTEG